MKRASAVRRVLILATSGLATAVAAGFIGCSPGEVGTLPSSKSQVSEYLSKEPETGQISQGGKKGGAAAKGPLSIKKKLLNPAAQKTE